MTRDVPLLGAASRASTAPRWPRARRPVAAIDGLVRRYGDRVEELVALIEARPELAEPLEGGGGHLRAEVVHACTHEGALRLEDVLERRTRLALTAPDRGLAAAAPRGGADGRRARLGPRRARREAEAWRARVAAARAAEAERDDERALAAYRGGARRASRRGGAAVTALVLGLDQGTSSTRCVALDGELRERGASSVAVASSFPGPGLVEQDPEAIAESAEHAIAGALAAAGARPRDVAALGIANQTETFVVWERATGRPIHPAIVWQDRRTDAACAELRAEGHEELVRERTGLELDATFPATKLRWLLDHVEVPAPRRGRAARVRRRRLVAPAPAGGGPRDRRRQRRPLAALPARRAGLGRRAARALRRAALAAPADRGLGPDRRRDRGRPESAPPPGTSRRRSSASAAASPARRR